MQNKSGETKFSLGLFLDDIRWPRDIVWVEFDYLSLNWEIVRNYDQFVQAVQEKEYDLFALDHDLCPLSTMECIRCSSTKEKFDYSKVKLKTGMHCALFLKEFYNQQNKPIPPYLVHSLNSEGRENMINILGQESLVATHSTEIFFDKSDEILKWRVSK